MKKTKTKAALARFLLRDHPDTPSGEAFLIDEDDVDTLAGWIVDFLEERASKAKGVKGE